jgi:hypothetical protein
MRLAGTLSATALMLFAGYANLMAAENSTDPANSLFAMRGGDAGHRSILDRLLNWPEAERQSDEDQGNDAEEKPLESDRPDFTDSSTTVPYRRLQVESGYQYTHAIDGDSTHNANDLPELLIRYGLAERLELRIAWDEGIVFEHFTDPRSGRIIIQNGSTDLQFGFRYALTRQKKSMPQSAITLSITAPVGSAAQSSRQVDTIVNYLYSWDFTEKLSLDCSTGGLRTAESGDRFSLFWQSASVEYELTDKLHVFNECYGLFRRNSNDNRPQYYYDAGTLYLVTPNFQLDWRAGLGLNGISDGFFTGCGLTIRK